MKLETIVTLAALGAAAFLVASAAKSRPASVASPAGASSYLTGFSFGGDPSRIFGAGLNLNTRPISLANPYGTAFSF